MVVMIMITMAVMVVPFALDVATVSTLAPVGFEPVVETCRVLLVFELPVPDIDRTAD